MVKGIIEDTKITLHKQMMVKEDMLFVYFLTGQCPHCKQIQTQEIMEIWRTSTYLVDNFGNPIKDADKLETMYKCSSCFTIIHRNSRIEAYSGKKPKEGLLVSSDVVKRTFL